MTFTEFTSLFHLQDFIMANIIALICTLLLNRKRRFKTAEQILSDEDRGQRYEYIVHGRSGEILHLYADDHSDELALIALCHLGVGAYKVDVRDRQAAKE